MATERFDEFLWHDSKLLAFAVERVGTEDLVRLHLLMRQPNGPPQSLDVVFLDTVYFQADVDLQGKRLCSDAIGAARCHRSPSWKDEIMRSHPGEDLRSYFHFSVAFIDPGGILNILAKNFVLEK